MLFASTISQHRLHVETPICTLNGLTCAQRMRCVKQPWKNITVTFLLSRRRKFLETSYTQFYFESFNSTECTGESSGQKISKLILPTARVSENALRVRNGRRGGGRTTIFVDFKAFTPRPLCDSGIRPFVEGNASHFCNWKRTRKKLGIAILTRRGHLSPILSLFPPVSPARAVPRTGIASQLSFPKQNKQP